MIFFSSYKFSNSRKLAKASFLQTCKCLFVRVMETESSYIGSMAFGLTGADPNQLERYELLDDLLSQRTKYWVITKDVLSHPYDVAYSISEAPRH